MSRFLNQLNGIEKPKKPEIVEETEITNDKEKDYRWTRYLRPRYVKSEHGVVKIISKRLHDNHIATLSESGGPYFAKTFTLPISSNSLVDAEYIPEGKKRGYLVTAEAQWERFRMFFRQTVPPGIYIIASDIRDTKLLQVIFTMFMHTVSANDCRHVKWGGLFGSYKDDLRDDKPELDSLVIANLHAGMDNLKFTKLRDLLYIYSGIPVFLVIDGVDPLEFSLRYLHEEPRLLLNIANVKTTSYVRRLN